VGWNVGERKPQKKALVPTGVFRTPSRRTGGVALIVCWICRKYPKFQ